VAKGTAVGADCCWRFMKAGSAINGSLASGQPFRKRLWGCSIEVCMVWNALTTSSPSQFNEQHVSRSPTPDALGLRSKSYEIAKTVCTQSYRNGRFQYDRDASPISQEKFRSKFSLLPVSLQ